MQKILLLILGSAGLSVAAVAGPQTFDFKDPKGVNNVAFKLDAPLESISGTASGISGTVTFDPEKAELSKGKITLATASLHVGNPTMKEHLHGDKWMDVTKHPEIIFEFESLKSPVTADNQTVGQATGTLTVRGVARKVTLPVKITYLKDKLQARLPQLKGDLLVLRSNFKIKRSDYGINPGNSEDKVSDEIDLSLSIAGQSPR